jgi:hypothetical protein
MRRFSVASLALVLVMAFGVASCARLPRSSSGSPAKPSVAKQLTVAQAIALAYKAGFRTEGKLTAVVSIAVAESSLRTAARNWHPEYGFRPAGTRLGVTGPATAWNASRTRQHHSDRGLWQISSRWWPQYTDAQTDDPTSAARLVFAISKGGADFSKWDAYKYGSAKQHFDQARNGWPAIRPKVRAYLAAH